MAAAYVTDLERLISQSRLDKYRPTSRDDLETVVNYLWNVTLSESLLQGISAVEIALRNSIHNACTVSEGSEYWFWSILRKEELRFINERLIKFVTELKEPPPAGKIIADLTFGFWPHLFDNRYKDFWWDNKEAMLKAVFPYRPTGLSPRAQINRAEILKRLKLLLDLRNRAVHHEPIMFGIARPDLGSPPPIVSILDAHTQLVEMLRWIDPQLSLTLSFVDRFPDVHQNERSRIEAKLKAEFNIP